MRRSLLAAAAALSLLASGCSDPAEPESPDAGGSTTTADEPTIGGGTTTAVEPSAPEDNLTPPAGTRWVGVANIVIAVPEEWATETSPCVNRQTETVLFLTESAIADCVLPRGGVPSAVFTWPGHPLMGHLGRNYDVGYRTDGITVFSDQRCWTKPAPYCRLGIVSGRKREFSVALFAPGSRTEAGAPLQAIAETIRRVPKGVELPRGSTLRHAPHP